MTLGLASSLFSRRPSLPHFAILGLISMSVIGLSAHHLCGMGVLCSWQGLQRAGVPSINRWHFPQAACKALGEARRMCITCFMSCMLSKTVRQRHIIKRIDVLFLL